MVFLLLITIGCLFSEILSHVWDLGLWPKAARICPTKNIISWRCVALLCLFLKK